MSRKKMSEETKAAMEFAAAMGLCHDLGSFRARKKAKKEAFQPEVSFSFI